MAPNRPVISTEGLDNSKEPTGSSQCLSPLSSFFMAMPQPPDIYAVTQVQGYCRPADMVGWVTKFVSLQPRLATRFRKTSAGWQAQEVPVGQMDVAARIKEVLLSEAATADEGLSDFVSKLMSGPPLGDKDDLLWDITLVHHSCDLQRTDMLLRASHVLGDGQRFLTNLQAIMEVDTTKQALRAQQAQDRVEAEAWQKQPAKEVPVAEPASPKDDLIKAVPADALDPTVRKPKQQQQEQQQQQASGLHRRTVMEKLKAFPAAAAHVKSSRTSSSSSRKARSSSLTQMLRRGAATLWRSFLAALLLVNRIMQAIVGPWTALWYTLLQPLFPSDPVNSIKATSAELVGPRRWVPLHLPLPEFHATAKASGQTVNALAVACVVGGVRRYLRARGEAVPSSLRVCSMVDTRAMAAEMTGLGTGASNNFSFIAVPIRTSSSVGPLERVRRVGAALNWIRYSPAVAAAIRIPAVVQALLGCNELAARFALWLMPYRTTIGFSNVRGPQQPLRLAGFPVVHMYNGVQPSSWGAFVSLFSYDDIITFTASTFCHKADCRELLQHITAEYKDLAAGMGAGSHAGARKSRE